MILDDFALIEFGFGGCIGSSYVPYEGFSRPREVVKPRRKAKNLVFGHP